MKAGSKTSNKAYTLQEFHTDIVIAGGGLAGLTLGVELAQRSAFAGKQIVVLDRDAKQRNDRTWCFWATPSEPLPPVVHKTWSQCRFYAPDFEKKLDIDPFHYHMVRGQDFYQWAHGELARRPNIRRIQANIERIDATLGRVYTDHGVFTGNLVFNSAFTKTRVLPAASPDYPEPPLSAAPEALRRKLTGHLLQHFCGWIIETETPVFDPACMTFMDFRPQQHGETRFVYVLPFTDKRALVEFTLFSPALLARGAYDEDLRSYLSRHLNIRDFRVVETEFGVIPMTDFRFPHRQEGRVIHIGTAGGFVKASSGYAFKRTQRKIWAFVDDWARTGRPNPAVLRSPYVFRAFDSIFLRVLRNNNALGGLIFKCLFEKLPAALVFRFLDEDSTFVETLRLVSAPPPAPFLGAFFQQLPGLFRI